MKFERPHKIPKARKIPEESSKSNWTNTKVPWADSLCSKTFYINAMALHEVVSNSEKFSGQSPSLHLHSQCDYLHGYTNLGCINQTYIIYLITMPPSSLTNIVSAGSNFHLWPFCVLHKGGFGITLPFSPRSSQLTWLGRWGRLNIKVIHVVPNGWHLHAIWDCHGVNLLVTVMGKGDNGW